MTLEIPPDKISRLLERHPAATAWRQFNRARAAKQAANDEEAEALWELKYLEGWKFWSPSWEAFCQEQLNIPLVDANKAADTYAILCAAFSRDFEDRQALATCRNIEGVRL